MNHDSLNYLANNTDITFLSEGSIARALVEASNAEVSKVQEYIVAAYSNNFLNTAGGYYLDLLGQMLGIRRLPASAGSSTAEDGNVQFSVTSGTLGNRFPNPGNQNLGKISAGLKVMTSDNSIVYRVSEDVTFPASAKHVFVPVVSEVEGASYRVGRGKLVLHNGPAGVNVTNLKSIENAAGTEPDSEYRYRLANAMLTNVGTNATAIRLAAIGSADVSNVILQEFARGAGTFDALLVPVGNTVTFRSSQVVQRAVERVSAFGISARVKEPDYIRFKISIQLIPANPSNTGAIDVSKLRAKNAILNYMETIPLGGEFIVNALKSEVLTAVDSNIKDLKIIELCLDGNPHSIRNVKLKATELFTPDNYNTQEAVQVI
jgi:uncharacterized phage protein gp47/JayE